MEHEPLQIVHHPHPALRYKSKPVRRVDAGLAGIIREMFQLMYESNGIGLAANQVNLPLRLFVVNLAANPDEGEEMVFINPVISKPKGSEEGEEGCLSLPQLYAPVRRPKQVLVNAYNLKGEEVQATVTGMLSRVVQHETDHLDGIMFPDRMTDMHRPSVEPVLEEFELEFDAQRRSGKMPPDEEITARLQKYEALYC
jgi:peptide deformylase